MDENIARQYASTPRTLYLNLADLALTLPAGDDLAIEAV
jgi:hypothetical protein